MLRYFEHPSRRSGVELVAPIATSFEEITISDAGERVAASRDLATYDDAVAAYLAAVRALLAEGYVERPASLPLRRAADGETRAVRLPAFSTSGERDDHRRHLRASIERAAAAYHRELAGLRAEGFEITMPAWHDGLPAPGAPFRQAEELHEGTEQVRRRYFVSSEDASQEAGPEWRFDGEGRTTQVNFQVGSKVDGARLQHNDDQTWAIATFVADRREGLTWLLRPNGTIHQVQRVSSGRLDGCYNLDEHGALTSFTEDGTDEAGHRRGRWDFFDAENHTVRTYEHGEPRRVEFRRLADDTMEQRVDHVAGGRTVTIYTDDGAAVTSSGPTNDQGERTGVWTWFDALGGARKTITYDPPGTAASVWERSRDDEVARPTRRFERTRLPPHSTPLYQLLKGVPQAQTMIIDSVAAARKPWRKKQPCRRFVLRGDVTDDVLAAVLAHKLLPTIESLELSDTHQRLGDAFVRALRAGQLAHLREVHVGYVKDLGVLEAICDELPRLEVLELSLVPLDDAGLARLLARRGLASVKSLKLASIDMGAATAKALAEGALPSLAGLELSHVPLGDEALRTLANGPATQRLERFSYHHSTRGEPRAPAVALTVHAMPVLEALFTIPSLLYVSIGLELVEVATMPVHELEPVLAGERSLEAFRRLWAGVEARPETLSRVVSRIAAWPAELRVAPPFAINKLVDGRLPASFLALARGLHMFDLVLDETTNLPTSAAQVDERLAALTGWLRGLTHEADCIEVLDLSPEGWRATFDPSLFGIYFSITAETWSALFAAFRGVRVLNLSQSDVAYDVTSSDAYRDLASVPNMEGELQIARLLRDAPLTAQLEELYLQGYTMSPLRVDSFPVLPRLRVLDLSGAHRTAAPGFGAKAPALETLILGGDSLVTYALGGGAATDLASEHDLDDQATLEELLIGDPELRALQHAMPRLKTVLLGGEVARKRVKATKQAWPFAVRDARGRSDRRWLPW